MSTIVVTVAVVLVIIFFIGIRIVRPVERGIVERFGKNIKIDNAGFHWIIPIVDRFVRVNVTEQMVDVQPQTVITKDKLNAVVDAVVYYQIKDVLAATYNVDDHEEQLTSLARTTLRAVIGKMTLTEANENRDEINSKVELVLDKETNSYGVEILRVEIQSIDPPQDVQIAMNEVVKAEQEKIAAKDLATAKETEADGERRAEIKRAEGRRQATILEANGEAQAIIQVADAKAKEIKLVNEAATKYFKGDAQVLKKLETTEASLAKNTKMIIDSNSSVANIISDISGVQVIPTAPKRVVRK